MSNNDEVKIGIEEKLEIEESKEQLNELNIEELEEKLYEKIRQKVIQEITEKENIEKLKYQQELEEKEKARKNYVEDMRESNIPWFDLTGFVVEGDNLKVEMEWNASFITMLKNAGIAGITDDEIVKKWLNNIIIGLEETLEDNSNKSEYL